MSNLEYTLVKVCSRAGIEYYHIYPEKSIGFLPKDYSDLDVHISHPKFSVISFPDCDVTIFASGRMLIENLPEDSEERARAIVRKIMKIWRQSKSTKKQV